jgi:RimJ/RimL family protein N-acetyltransferase
VDHQQSLVTERLVLRQWQPEDSAPFAELNADPVTMEYFPQTLTWAESDALAERCQAHITEQGWGLWAVELKSTTAFLGFVGLRPIPDEMPFAPAVEVGWRLRRQFWGQGFATEAALASLAFGFNELQLPEIVSFTATCNQRSWKVMERIGMRRTGEFEHPRVAVGHHLRPHYLYRLAAAEFTAGR